METADLKIINQISVLATNKPGVLANICGALNDQKINIRGISVIDHIDHAMIRMIVDDTTAAIHLLGEAGLPIIEDEVIHLPLSYGPGALEKIASAISESRHNIHYLYGTEPPEGGLSRIIVKTDNNQEAIKVLRAKLGS